MYFKRLCQCVIIVWLTRTSDSSPSANISEGDEDNRVLDPLSGVDILDDDEEDDNTTVLGMYLGGRCKGTCSDVLVNVYCDATKGICMCNPNHPVRLGPRVGCEAPTLLGEMCFYSETCSFYDSNAMCKQIGHNAMCDCKPGYHTVGIQKGVKRMFCSEDIVLLHTDLPSLFVVAMGIAVLSGLLCFVLKLFSNNRFADGGHYANANIAPPLLFSDNQWINGIPLAVHGRPASRSSSQRSTTHLTHYRSKGVLVPASRAGAARAAAILLIPCHLQSARAPDVGPSSNEEELDTPLGNTWMYPLLFPDVQISLNKSSRRASISSVHSNASSNLSYSQRRFDQENNQREQRATMKAAREEAARSAVPPTPSPMSTDHLLPSCEELNEDDPLGISASMLSIRSADCSEENSLDKFPMSGTSTKI